MPRLAAIVVFALLLSAGCYATAPDPGAALPAEVASIRLIDQSGADRTAHLPLFTGIPETLTVHPYRADGTAITTIEGGATSSWLFSPTDLTTVAGTPDPLTKVVTTASPPGASGFYNVTLDFPFDTASRSFGPFYAQVH